MSDKGIEREKKFLIKEIPENLVDETKIVQGYFGTLPLRVRMDMDINWNVESDITIEHVKKALVGYKYPAGGTENREESESPIDPKIALRLIEECGTRVIRKTRKDTYIDGNRWEIDFFHGKLQGLITAEYEFTDNTAEMPPIPTFIGKEITTDQRYSNHTLSLYQNISEIL